MISEFKVSIYNVYNPIRGIFLEMYSVCGYHGQTFSLLFHLLKITIHIILQFQCSVLTVFKEREGLPIYLCKFILL